jgi:hypothetical protein
VSNRNQNQSNKAVKEEMVEVSQPELDTGTQIDRAVGNIIAPITRDRCTREQMEAKN